MKTDEETAENKKNNSPAALVSGWAILLSCCLFHVNIAYAQSNPPAAPARQKADPAKAVQNDVEASIAKKINEQRKVIIQEAVTAVAETHIIKQAS